MEIFGTNHELNQPANTMTKKIATWNVNSLRVRMPQLLEWLDQVQPDIVALQETKVQDKDFPADALEVAGYKVIYSGQKSYNGVAIISRHTAADEIITDIPGLDDPQRRILAATYNGLRVINLYVPNGQSVGSEKFHYKLEWLNQVRLYIASQLQQYPRLVVLGDFNIAPDERDVHDPEQWHDKILCSDEERAALQQIHACGLKDSFRLFDQPDGSFSWWDYRMAAFRRNLGLRIDLVLASEALCKQALSCHIDTSPRGLERPSDHAPVVAEFDD